MDVAISAIDGVDAHEGMDGRRMAAVRRFVLAIGERVWEWREGGGPFMGMGGDVRAGWEGGWAVLRRGDRLCGFAKTPAASQSRRFGCRSAMTRRSAPQQVRLPAQSLASLLARLWTAHAAFQSVRGDAGGRVYVFDEFRYTSVWSNELREGGDRCH